MRYRGVARNFLGSCQVSPRDGNTPRILLWGWDWNPQYLIPGMAFGFSGISSRHPFYLHLRLTLKCLEKNRKNHLPNGAFFMVQYEPMLESKKSPCHPTQIQVTSSTSVGRTRLLTKKNRN